MSGTASMPVLFRFDVVHNSPTGVVGFSVMFRTTAYPRLSPTGSRAPETGPATPWRRHLDAYIRSRSAASGGQDHGRRRNSRVVASKPIGVDDTARTLELRGREAGTMGYLNRMGFFDFLADGVEVLPSRPFYSAAERHRGGNAALVEIARIRKDARDEQLGSRPQGLIFSPAGNREKSL